MLSKPSEKNSYSFYYTPEEKSSKLGLFSAARVVLPLKIKTRVKVISSHNWEMEISSLGFHKFRCASTGTSACFLNFMYIFKILRTNSKTVVSISVWEILSSFWLKL